MRIPRALPVYPWGDNEQLCFGDESDVAVYWDGSRLLFDPATGETSGFSWSAANFSIKGGTTADYGMILYANSAATTPRLQLEANAGITATIKAGTTFAINDGTTASFTFSHSGADNIITSVTDAHNLFLSPTGTGKVKFGTYTATAALASVGYIDILDAAGNARKVMIQA